MTSKKFSWLLLCLTLTVAGIAYTIIHRSASKKEYAISQVIAELELSGFPDTFRTQLEIAEHGARRDAPSSESVLKLARLYHANSFYDEAVHYYQILLGNEDEALRAKAHYYIATIKEVRNDLETAAEHLRAVIDLTPDYLPAHLSLAEIHYKSGNLSDAVTSFEAALNIKPTNPYALIGLARERIQNGDDSMALAHLGTLVSSNPNFTNGTSLLAQILERNGQSGQAAVARKMSLAGWNVPPEDPWMKETMKLCYDTQRLSIFFEDYKRVGQIDRAMTYLDRIEAVDADNWYSRLMRAHAYTESGKYEESIPYYELALELGGDPSVIYPLLAKTYFEMNRYKEAESMARSSIGLSPNNTEALQIMAGIHLQINQPKEAISLFQKVVSIDPYHLLANTVLAKFHWQTGDRTTASNHLKTIQQVDPSDLFSRVFLGQYFMESNRLLDALPPLEEAYVLDPSDEYVLIMLPDAYATIGEIQQDNGDFDSALEYYNKALAITANHSAATNGKASLQEKSAAAD
ncbi:MAG: tetratricopeptide (TPR) repeat protein [Candidatus Pelagisphaera sp.]|jgi:tetratricopeptide (TPR) repeat protein